MATGLTQASTLSSFVQIVYVTNSGAHPAFEEIEKPVGIASATLNASYGRTDPWPYSTFFAEAAAVSQYGLLRAYSFGRLHQNGGVFATHHLVAASASFSDTLVFHRAGDQSAALVQFFLQLSGTATGSFERGEAHGSLRVGVNGLPPENLAFNAVSGGLFSSQLYQMNFGQPLGLDVHLDSLVSIVSDRYPYEGMGVADFRGTVQLTGIRVYNPQGGIYTDYSVAALSGADYPTPDVVPEPAGLLALAGGVLPMALRCLRKSS